MLKKTVCLFLLSLMSALLNFSQEKTKVYPGADEKTPSRAQYFSWINNTNEGATETQALINLDFFQWLRDEYGMVIDIYAFDAGALDGKRFYGKIDSDRFRRQFPNGFKPIYEKAKAMGTRLGIWGGPDGFGDTPAEEAARIEQMVSLCRDWDFALFKFDAVCGPLRPEKEDAFIRMMTKCRDYSPDLILLNHRLGFEKAQAHATTFLWEGKETYIDVFSTNTQTAPHHRADAISRGLVPDLQRLTEDHGVCLSSCLDYWEDDLILQAFNRCLILAPQLYGNPWLLRDEEFPRLARIFNLHREYRKILVEGMVLPEERFGPHAVSRGDGTTRLLTLRNLSWEPVTYSIPLDATIGLEDHGRVHCRLFHPVERFLGNHDPGGAIAVEVSPFRSCLLLATTQRTDEPGVKGCDYEVVRKVEGRPVLIHLKGLPGTQARVSLLPNSQRYAQAILGGKSRPELLEGEAVTCAFPGRKLQQVYHAKLADLRACAIPPDASALYEATVFAGDNNALEVRSLFRSGPTLIPQVRKAREAFFNQDVFLQRGVWDQNLFDGDFRTGFWPSWKYGIDQRVQGGCLRIDLGAVTDIDQLVLYVPDEYSLQPLLRDEANFVDVSTDLISWERLTYMAGTTMTISLSRPIRYLRFRAYPHRIMEIEGFQEGRPLSRKFWRASNLFAHPRRMKPLKAWKGEIRLNEWVKGGYLCVAVAGDHGIEGAYAALKVDGKLMGCPDRAPSFPSNTWEYVNARRDRNYTYYIPLTGAMIEKTIEVFVLAYTEGSFDLKPSVWKTAYPAPLETVALELVR